jgi:hypothetical protein
LNLIHLRNNIHWTTYWNEFVTVKYITSEDMISVSIRLSTNLEAWKRLKEIKSSWVTSRVSSEVYFSSDLKRLVPREECITIGPVFIFVSEKYSHILSTGTAILKIFKKNVERINVSNTDSVNFVFLCKPKDEDSWLSSCRINWSKLWIKYVLTWS